MPSRALRGIPTHYVPLALGALLVSACFEQAERWYREPPSAECNAGSVRCNGSQLELCAGPATSPAWQTTRDCALTGLVCANSLKSCVACTPGSQRCNGQTIEICGSDGGGFTATQSCDANAGEVCRAGTCSNLCADAAKKRSNVGCEYWAVDLDNARVSDTSNAAAQQYAIVLSNPEPDVSAEVVIEQDDAAPGEAPRISEVARASVPPFSLRVFKLGPREVDGSAPGTFDTGSGTALSRGAYRVRSTIPLVAYQFNPLENVNVFSNDASLLKPIEAMPERSSALSDAYVVLSWPQTIAKSDNPRTNFGSNLRAFLTLVGTRDNTHVQVTSAARVVAGGPVAETPAGGTLEATLDAFDVLNLETGDFNADFSGSLVRADGPLVVFTGSEASDAPWFPDLSQRSCCADHLEEQLDPARTAGKSFIASVSPNRAAAVVAAGAKLDVLAQPEYFRVIAVTDAGARITTTLEGELGHFELPGKASYVELASSQHFALTSDAPIMMTSVSPSQDAANIPRGLPGGDPSLLVLPPIEQFRSTYVFLTPDKYSFDFMRIIAPPDARIVFDGVMLEELQGCSAAPIRVAEGAPTESTSAAALAPNWVVYSCQLSFPNIDPNLAAPANLSPGLQNDGVHRLASSKPVGLLVDGFDSYVSYAYAGGTELEFLVPE